MRHTNFEQGSDDAQNLGLRKKNEVDPYLEKDHLTGESASSELERAEDEYSLSPDEILMRKEEGTLERDREKSIKSQGVEPQNIKRLENSLDEIIKQNRTARLKNSLDPAIQKHREMRKEIDRLSDELNNARPGDSIISINKKKIENIYKELNPHEKPEESQELVA